MADIHKIPEKLTLYFEERKENKITEEIFQKEVKEVLKNYSTQNNKDWKQFELFSDLHYTRNLVFANEHYELMVICWKSGQGSRIHNHANSHCWMTILHGQMIEEIFKLIDPNVTPTSLPAGDCPKLEKLSCRKHGVGDVGYINDSMGLHVMRTCELHDGISLHLYAPPITNVRIFEPARQRLTMRTPGFYSVDGKRVDPTERLFYDLANIFELFSYDSEESSRKIQIVLKEYARSSSNEWKKYVHFNDTHYTRNLIRRNEQFDLVVVCWKSGHSSRIQSHSKHTWMCVLEGSMTEYHYDLFDSAGNVYLESEKPTPVGSCPTIREKAEFHRNTGDTSHMHDSIAIQSFLVGELSDCVSLHVYAPPQDKEVKIFEPARSLVSLRTPGFYSINGVLTNR
jgi:cysteine dioxygenase